MRTPDSSLGLALVAWALLPSLACGVDGASGTEPAVDPPLPQHAFAQPWIVIDRVGSGRPIDAVVRGPAGFLALTHLPTLDGKVMPTRSNIAAFSADGVNWVEQTIVPDGYYSSVAFGAGRYVAVGGLAPLGGPGVVVASTDGRNWTAVARVEPGPVYGAVLTRVQHTPLGFVAVGMGGSALSSIDGITWRTSSLSENPPDSSLDLYRDAAYGAGRFLAVGTQSLSTSSDGQRWSRVVCGSQLPCHPRAAPNLWRALFGNRTFLVTGTVGLFRSIDGLAWSQAGSARGSDIIFAGGLFLERASLDHPMNTSFAVSTSQDGAIWEPRTTASVVRSDLTCATRRCLVFESAILLVP
jgi:hypothetical protein